MNVRLSTTDSVERLTNENLRDSATLSSRMYGETGVGKNVLSYSQTLDELLGFDNTKPPTAAPRKLSDSVKATTSNGRPSTRHGSRSSISNNNTSSSSSSNSHQSAKSPRKIFPSSSTTNLNVWKRRESESFKSEDEEQNEKEQQHDEEETPNNKEDLEETTRLSSASSISESSSQSADTKDEAEKEANFERRLKELAQFSKAMKNPHPKTPSPNNSNRSSSSSAPQTPIGIEDKATKLIKNTVVISSPVKDLPNRKKPSVICENDEEFGKTSPNPSSSSPPPPPSLPPPSLILSKKKTLLSKPPLNLTNPKPTTHSEDISWSRIRSSSLEKPPPPKTAASNQTISSRGSKFDRFPNEKSATSTRLRPVSTTVASLSGRKPLSDEQNNSYKTWIQQKLEIKKEKLRKLTEKEQSEKLANEEKRKEAAKCFEKWKLEHDRQLVEVQRVRKRTVEDQKLREKLQKEEKEQSASKSFEHWKQTLVERLRAERVKSAHAVRTRAKSLAEVKQAKSEEAEMAFSAWLKDFDKRKHLENERRKSTVAAEQDLLDKVQKYKEELSREAYALWLKMKNEEQKYAQSLTYKILEFESTAKKQWPAVPWLPSGNTIPRKFVGSGHRRMTLEKPVHLRNRRTQSTH